MRIITRHAIVQSIVMPICPNLGRGLRDLLSPQTIFPVNSFPRSSIDHFCPRRSTRQLRRHPESTEKRFYGRRTPIRLLVRQPPSTGFSLQVANFKNSFGGFRCTRVCLLSLPDEGIVSCKQISTTRLTGLFGITYSFPNASVYIGRFLREIIFC